MHCFHLLDNEEVVVADGTELPDLDAAREHARQVARELTFKRDGMAPAEVVTMGDVRARQRTGIIILLDGQFREPGNRQTPPGSRRIHESNIRLTLFSRPA